MYYVQLKIWLFVYILFSFFFARWFCNNIHPQRVAGNSKQEMVNLNYDFKFIRFFLLFLKQLFIDITLLPKSGFGEFVWKWFLLIKSFIFQTVIKNGCFLNIWTLEKFYNFNIRSLPITVEKETFT